ncbi:hypothetical protein FKM82_023187 [Ascaphus truei]
MLSILSDTHWASVSCRAKSSFILQKQCSLVHDEQTFSVSYRALCLCILQSNLPFNVQGNAFVYLAEKCTLVSNVPLYLAKQCDASD